MRYAKVLVALFSLAVCTACGGGSSSPTAPSANVPYSQIDLLVGSGTEAVTGRVTLVNYSGWLYDAAAPANKGSLFDTSLASGRTPLVVTLGAGSVIPGFERGILGMRVGGKRTVIIPPDLAYGSRGSGGVIPPNATLVFDIELLAVQ